MHLARASLLTLIASFTPSSYHLAALLHTISFFPVTSLAMSVTKCPHSFITFTPTHISLFDISCTYGFQHLAEFHRILPSLPGTPAFFLPLLVLLLPICTTSYPGLFVSCRVLAFSPYLPNDVWFQRPPRIHILPYLYHVHAFPHYIARTDRPFLCLQFLVHVHCAFRSFGAFISVVSRKSSISTPFIFFFFFCIAQ